MYSLLVILGFVLFFLLALRWWDQRAERMEWGRLAALQPTSPELYDPVMVAALPEPARRFFNFAIGGAMPILRKGTGYNPLVAICRISARLKAFASRSLSRQATCSGRTSTLRFSRQRSLPCAFQRPDHDLDQPTAKWMSSGLPALAGVRPGCPVDALGEPLWPE